MPVVVSQEQMVFLSKPFASFFVVYFFYMEKDPQKLMEQGWKAREDYRFPESEKLLTQAYNLFLSQGDYLNASECLNHLAYLYKTISFTNANLAKDHAQKALKLCQKHHIKDTLAFRANSSVYKYAGNFEKAEKYLLKFLEKETHPAPRADILGDLAFITMRRGNIQKAQEIINEALGELEKGWEDERMPHKMIWKTKLLMYKSLILYNLDDKVEARKLAQEAQKLAKDNNLKMRLAESQELLKLF